MAGNRFVHLHVHSEFSLLDGAIRLPKLIEKVKGMGMNAVALTDHGNMFGAEEFSHLCQNMGIKGIIGCEVYTTPGRAEERNGNSPIHHLILLAMNEKGYRNLCKLNTYSFFRGFYQKPRLDREILKEHSGGLIAMSACLKGEVPSWIRGGNLKEAERAASEYARIFPDRFYLELQDNGIAEQYTVNKELADMGKRLGLPLVATNDCHYLEKEEAKVHDLLLCIQTHKKIEDKDRLKFQTDEFYFKSAAKMSKDFSWAVEAITNTIRIADSCDFELKRDGCRFPSFPVEKGKSHFECLRELATGGLERRLAENVKDGEDSQVSTIYRGRLESELEVIRETGFSTYFLIVWDIINYAKGEGIVVGPGRGSSAGSLVAYALRITEIDPIPHKLLFERFLNRERSTYPDIDIDFSHDDREKITRYLTGKYGADRVAHIGTFHVIKAKLAVKDAGRALDIPFSVTDRITKFIPDVVGETVLLEDLLAKEPRLREMQEEDPKIRELFDMAASIQGLVRNNSIHAAGIVISDQELDNLVPLMRGKKNEIVTQYEMKSIERLGLIKFDILAIKTLTLIKNTLEGIRKKGGLDIAIDRIPYDDPETFKLLSSGRTAGVFQMESSGMIELAKRLKPERMAHIADLIALYRPGPLGSGLVDNFIKRRRGEEEVKFDLPEMEEILKDTHGITLYQEQVMMLAVKLAGLSMTKADTLRHAMGKKIRKEMLQLSKEFIEGCVKRGIAEDIAAGIYERIAKFAEYGFNKSHSVAYAYVAYITAYLKANFPVYFMASLLSINVNDPKKVVRYLNECKNMGIEILPPDVNESEFQFTPLKKAIRFGLSGIANLGSAAFKIIEAERKDKPFSSFYDFLQRVDLSKVNKKVIESLIKSGAFDSLEATREGCWEVKDAWMEEAGRRKGDRIAGQINIFSLLSEEGSSSPRDTRKTPALTGWTESERIKNEKEATGFYITGHPMDIYGKGYEKFADHTIGELLSMISGPEEGEMEGENGGVKTNGQEDYPNLRVCGIVSSLREIRKKTIWAEIVLEDPTGMMEVLVFSDLYSQAGEILHSVRPVIVTGDVRILDNTIKMVAREIRPLEDVRAESVQTLGIRLVSPGDLQEEKLLRLKELLTRDSGKAKVMVSIALLDRYEVVLRLSKRYRVRVDDPFIDSMMRLFGRDVISIFLKRESNPDSGGGRRGRPPIRKGRPF